jgi:hypothetical protein
MMSVAKAVQMTAKAQDSGGSTLLLQRKCACGGSAGLTGECEECRTQRLLGKPLQAKLRINQPGDEYEQEADRVADQVMRMPDEPVRSENMRSTTTPLLQRRGTGGGTSFAGTSPVLREALSSQGKPLDPAARAFFEPRFGHDFGNVRVHSDARAAKFARDVEARAFTVGNDIVLGTGHGNFRQGSEGELLAHELTHVVQQQRGSLSTPSSETGEHTQPQSLLKANVARFAPESQASPLPLTIREKANATTLYRSSVVPEPESGAQESGTAAQTSCFTNTDSEPPAGWSQLRDEAKSQLTDSFSEAPSFRNKGSAQYRIELKDETKEPLSTRIFSYHSGRKGGSKFAKELKSDIDRLNTENALKPGKTLVGPGDRVGGSFHNEDLMAWFEKGLVRNNEPRIKGISSYVFSLFSPCSTCESVMRSWPSTPVEIKRYVDSLCIGREWNDEESERIAWQSGHIPVSGSGRVEKDNPNCELAKRLKLTTGDILNSEGWTRYTVTDELCVPEQEGVSGKVLKPLALAAAVLTAMTATAAVLETGAKKGAEEALEEGGQEALERGVGKAFGEGAETTAVKAAPKVLKRGVVQATEKVAPGLALLGVIVGAYLMATDQAEASVGLSGDDPLMFLVKQLALEGDPIPEPLRTMLENDEEFRRIVEEAAGEGGLPAAQRAAADHAAQILSDNIDQFSNEEIEALLSASQAAGSQAPYLEPTVERLKAEARYRGVEVDEEAVAGAGPGGPSAAPAGAPGEAREGGEGEGSGAGMGAPRELEGVTPNVQRLWKVLTDETRGLPLDRTFAQEFKEQIGDLSEQQLNDLFETLVDVEGEPDPYEVLRKLKARLDEPEPTSEPKPEGGAETEKDEPGAEPGGEPEIAEGSTIERLEPLAGGGLNTEQALEDLKQDFKNLPATDWPAEVRRWRYKPFTEEPKPRAQVQYRNRDGQRCLQYAEIELISRVEKIVTIQVKATSPAICEVGGELLTYRGSVQVGENVDLQDL